MTAYPLLLDRSRTTCRNLLDYAAAGEAMRLEQPSVEHKIITLTGGYCRAKNWIYWWNQCNGPQCPRCVHEVENVQHMWPCQGMESPKRWDTVLALIDKEMVCLQTAPQQRTIKMRQLHMWQMDSHKCHTSISHNHVVRLATTKISKDGLTSGWDYQV
jgi:hypothetical protein